MSVEDINWLKSGKYRILVLRLLAEQPMLPSELASEMSLHRVSVSRILTDLRVKGLVTRTRGRTRTTTYQVTELAIQLLHELNRRRK